MIQGGWYPQSEAEEQLLEDLHIVTRMAAMEGVSKARIASLTAFMASAAAQQAAYEESPQRAAQDLRERMEEQDAADPPDPDEWPICPHCETALTEFTGGLGTPRCPHCEEVILDDEIVEQVISDD